MKKMAFSPPPGRPGKPDNTSKIVIGVLVGTVVAAAFGYWIFSSRSKLAKPPSWDQHDAEMRVLDTQIKSLTAQIKAQSGSSKCSSDSDCHVVGLGVKTCGGYNDWLVYSSADVSEEDLLQTVREFNQAFERFMTLSLKVPSCGTAPKRIRCLNNVCEPI